MKDINEVLRKKEYELAQIQREVEALRIAARILSDEAETATVYASRPGSPPPAGSPAGSPYPQPLRTAQPTPATASADPGYGASWDAASKKFP